MGLVTRDGYNCAWGHGPLTVHKDGTRRCSKCRTAQRAKQRERAANRKAAVAAQAREVEEIVDEAGEDGELTEDQMRTLIEAGEMLDFGDDYALAARLGAPWVRVTDDERAEAAGLWQTGAAKKIMERAGVSATTFARMTGASKRSVFNWLNGKAPSSAVSADVAARVLLDLKMGNDDEDARLVAHGLPATLDAEKVFREDHAARKLARPYEHCDGCRKYRQSLGVYA